MGFGVNLSKVAKIGSGADYQSAANGRWKGREGVKQVFFQQRIDSGGRYVGNDRVLSRGEPHLTIPVSIRQPCQLVYLVRM